MFAGPRSLDRSHTRAEQTCRWRLRQPDEPAGGPSARLVDTANAVAGPDGQVEVPLRGGPTGGLPSVLTLRALQLDALGRVVGSTGLLDVVPATAPAPGPRR